MKRVIISLIIIVLMTAATLYLMNLIITIGEDMNTLSQQIITQTNAKASPERINSDLRELAVKWEKYEPIAVALAGRNHADSITIALQKALTFAYTEEDEDLILNLTELIGNVDSMCKTETFLPENFT